MSTSGPWLPMNGRAVLRWTFLSAARRCVASAAERIVRPSVSISPFCRRIMNARDLTALVHLVGFTTGIILYAMLGAMTRRRLSYVVAPTERRTDDRVPIAAALLGVVWNVGAMLVYAMRDFGLPYPLAVGRRSCLHGAGFPARGCRAFDAAAFPAQWTSILTVAYGASAIAGVAHAVAAARGGLYSAVGLLLLTVTYAALARRAGDHGAWSPGFPTKHHRCRVGRIRSVGAASESGGRHGGPGSVGDGADRASRVVASRARHSLPGLSIRLRGSLSQARARRCWQSWASYHCCTRGLPRRSSIHMRWQHVVAVDDGSHLAIIGVLLGLWIATALAYPFIQRRIYRFVDRVILGRTDYREFRADLGQRLAGRAMLTARSTSPARCSLTHSAPNRRRGVPATPTTLRAAVIRRSR